MNKTHRPAFVRALEHKIFTRKTGVLSRSAAPLMRPRILLWLLLTAASVHANAVDAPQTGENSSTPLKHLSLAQLGNIEVTTASKEPEEIWRTPAAVYVLTRDDIRRSGATSIPEVLRLVPGVEVARVNSSVWAVGIRGFGSAFSKSVLVLIDGRSVYTPLFAGVEWNVQSVLLEDVERIEVIRGPGGTIWGSNAVSGVINIITKSAKDTRGTYASTSGGNMNQSRSAVRYGGGRGNSFNYRAYAMGFGEAPEFHRDGDNYDDWQLGQAGFRTDSRPTDRDALTVQGDLYTDMLGNRSASPTTRRPTNGMWTEHNTFRAAISWGVGTANSATPPICNFSLTTIAPTGWDRSWEKHATPSTLTSSTIWS